MTPHLSHRSGTFPRREGKVLVLMALLLPGIFGVAAIILDGGMLMLDARSGQHATDAAATAAALDMALGTGNPTQTAADYVHSVNGLADAVVAVHSPPASGPYAGQTGYIEVTSARTRAARFARAAGMSQSLAFTNRSVAGLEDATKPAAIVILDPQPPQVNLGVLPVGLPSITPLLGGLEVLGVGAARVNGAIHVNNRWGGVDEHGNDSGIQSPLRRACSCTPLLPLTRVKATDVYVVGGVDHPQAYGPLAAGDPSPLRANRRPVLDPYRNLPVPTTAVDPVNVRNNYYGGVTVLNIPLLQPPTVLQPGVYDWIQVVAGRVVFQPGVYIIRGKNPVTQIGLSVLVGTIQAEGVMFYFTNSTGYAANNGSPDSSDGETAPAGPNVLTLVPSAVLNVGLLGSKFSPLNSPASPFHGLMIYQRRQDRRPILILNIDLLLGSDFAGNVYAKWGHVVLAGVGTYRSAFCAGSLRILDVVDCRIEPLQYLPAAKEVFLVE